MAIDSVFLKSGKSYRVRVRLPNGKRLTKCFDRMIDAKQWEAEVFANSQTYMRRQKIRFKDLASKFLENYVRPNSQPGTCIKYEGVLRNFILPYFEMCWVDAITKFQVEEFKGYVQSLDKSQALKNHIFGTFKTVLKKGVEWDFIDRNPAASVKPPKKGMARTEYWSKDEVNKFLLSVSTNQRLPLYLIALNTGMRAGEIFGLKWDCVDLENRLLTIRRIFDHKLGGIKETTKTHTARSIPINDSLLKVLIELKTKAEDEFVFSPSAAGCKCPSHVARTFKSDAVKAGVKVIKFHDLRHTFATSYVSNGGAIHALSGIMGHTSTSMTERYAHYDLSASRKSIEFVSFEVPKVADVLSLVGHKRVIKRTATS